MNSEDDKPGRVLIVAGSDSGGGAGIQADVKTVTALGGYAATAITALTAQNSLGVFERVRVEPAFVARQMEVVLTDIGADVIKTGMLVDARTIEAVVRTLERFARGVPVVVDPVLVAKDGTPLLDPAAQSTLELRLLPCAALLTPNVPEAEALSGTEIGSTDDMAHAAELLLAKGAAAVLVKGGHLPGETVTDVLRTLDGVERRFEAPRLESRSTHGTGCTLASAVAAGLAHGLTLEGAIGAARDYVFDAIRAAPGFGKGAGPLHHAHPFSKKGPE
jgi:hydroxymethylpyrimidine/phosphomethylpyrimidine kinase